MKVRDLTPTPHLDCAQRGCSLWVQGRDAFQKILQRIIQICKPDRIFARVVKGDGLSFLIQALPWYAKSICHRRNSYYESASAYSDSAIW